MGLNLVSIAPFQCVGCRGTETSIGTWMFDLLSDNSQEKTSKRQNFDDPYHHVAYMSAQNKLQHMNVNIFTYIFIPSYSLSSNSFDSFGHFYRASLTLIVIYSERSMSSEFQPCTCWFFIFSLLVLHFSNSHFPSTCSWVVLIVPGEWEVSVYLGDWVAVQK